MTEEKDGFSLDNLAAEQITNAATDLHKQLGEILCELVEREPRFASIKSSGEASARELMIFSLAVICWQAVDAVSQGDAVKRRKAINGIHAHMLNLDEQIVAQRSKTK